MYREIYNIFLAIYAVIELHTLSGFMSMLPDVNSFKSWIVHKISNMRIYIQALRIALFPIRGASIEHSRYRTTITYSEHDASDTLVTKTLLLPSNSKPYTWDKVYAEFEIEDDFSSTEEDTDDAEVEAEAKKKEKELLDDISLGPIWVDVTNDVEKVCGPHKDFYTVRITPSTINESWIKLKFVGKDAQNYVIFHKDDIIDRMYDL